MFSNLKDEDKVKYNDEIYTFIDINKITLGHFERGLKCKILIKYSSDIVIKKYCMDKLLRLFNYASNVYIHKYRDDFIILYNEIINNKYFDFLKELLKSYYFYIIIYKDEINKEKQEKKLKIIEQEKKNKRLSL